MQESYIQVGKTDKVKQEWCDYRSEHNLLSPFIDGRRKKVDLR